MAPQLCTKSISVKTHKLFVVVKCYTNKLNKIWSSDMPLFERYKAMIHIGGLIFFFTLRPIQQGFSIQRDSFATVLSEC